MTISNNNKDNSNCVLGKWAPLDYEDEWRRNEQKARQQELIEEKEKKVRIALCLYALLAMTLCQMSRMNLNVSIVEMVNNANDQSKDLHKSKMPINGSHIKQDDGSCPIEVVALDQSIDHHGKEDDDDQLEISPKLVSTVPEENQSNKDSASNDLIVPVQNVFTADLVGAESDNSNDKLEKRSLSFNQLPDEAHKDVNDDNGVYIEEIQPAPIVQNKFNWTTKQQSFLLGSFYIGYAPCMAIGGIIAEKYGNKYPILLSVAGSSLVNFLTPFLANLSFELLVLSRIFLGVIQASIFPSLYDLFSKWLTMTETSIFAPMIKVAYSIGAVVGSLLPGLIIGCGLGWPTVFYITGAICFVWALVWCLLSDSAPQQSRFVRQPELDRIMRKKMPSTPSSAIGGMPVNSCQNMQQRILSQQIPYCLDCNELTSNSINLATVGHHYHQQVYGRSNLNQQDQTKKGSKEKEAIPYKLIMTSPSVLSLILVKFTYQFCLDFIVIELASYLKNVFHAPVQLISATTVAMFAIHTVFMTFIGIIAKNMVRNKTFDWSKTTTRKVFQGLANFTMTIMYLLMSYSNCNLTMVIILLQVISVAFMFGAGGETMLPYDLSEKFPATIAGIAQSGCAVSGLVMALLTGQILGDRGNDNVRWNLLLRLVAGASFVGGLVFTLVAKAEPIEGKQQQLQQLSTSTATDSGANNSSRQKVTTSVHTISNQLRTDEQSNVRYTTSSSPSEVVVMNLRDVRALAQ